MALRSKWRPGDLFLVRHRDSAVVVVEKKAGLLTHTGPGQDERSLLGSLRAFVADRGRGTLKAVHRLDRVVSGLLVFARTEQAFERLRTQFAERTVDRVYLAAIKGEPEESSGHLEDFLDVEPLTVAIVDPEHARARRASTRFEVRERLPRARSTLLSVQLETGLRNQIRVQLAHRGWPLLGERKYDPERPKAQGNERVFLHAAELGFEHPVTRHRLRFEADLPPDLRRWLATLRSEAALRCPPPRRIRRPPKR